jgi:methylated-DNA-[protein]-cysteine S-methyltransferase
MVELSEHATPLGRMRIATSERNLVAMAFLDSWPRVERHLSRVIAREEWREGAPPPTVTEKLDAYLAGELEALDSISVVAAGTCFQRRVWAAIREVPAGSLLSYSELAAAAGSPNAVRAAGTACGANPIWLVIPCHRILRRDGDLGDYGGGLERKQWLINHEHQHARSRPTPTRGR